MNRIKLLRAIYKAIQWDKLYEALPGVNRQQVDDLFLELRDKLEAATNASEQAAANAPQQRRQSIPGGEGRLHFDGASRGNPGPAGIGMILTTAEGQELLAWGDAIGRATSNVAEYRALIEGLKKALELNVRRIRLLSDSELLVLQLRGAYRVKSGRLKPLYSEATSLLEQFDSWEIRHIRREQNRKADALATQHAKAR